MPKTFDTQILGKHFSFQLSDDLSPQEFAQVIDYVEKRLNQIKARIGETDTFRLGLLVAVNIAQDLFSLKCENEKLRKILERIDSLLDPQGKEDGVPIRFSS